MQAGLESEDASRRWRCARASRMEIGTGQSISPGVAYKPAELHKGTDAKRSNVQTQQFQGPSVAD